MSDPSPQPQPSAARNVYAFGLTSFFNDTASEMAYWVLPAFLATLGAGPAQLGIIEGIAESVASFAKLFSGYLSDHFPRRKPLVVSGYFVANVVKPLLALATSWWQILGIRFADRFSKGIRGTARDVMVADSVGKGHLGSAYGLIQAMDSAGAIAGPLAALLLVSHHGLRGIFWAAGVPGFLCVLVALLGIRETRAMRGPAATDARAVPWWQARFSRTFYFVLVAVTLFSLGNSIVMNLAPPTETYALPLHRALRLGHLSKPIHGE